jgi:hypothetical protein
MNELSCGVSSVLMRQHACVKPNDSKERGRTCVSHMQSRINTHTTIESHRIAAQIHHSSGSYTLYKDRAA